MHSSRHHTHRLKQPRPSQARRSLQRAGHQPLQAQRPGLTGRPHDGRQHQRFQFRATTYRGVSELDSDVKTAADSSFSSFVNRPAKGGLLQECAQAFSPSLTSWTGPSHRSRLNSRKGNRSHARLRRRADRRTHRKTRPGLWADLWMAGCRWCAVRQRASRFLKVPAYCARRQSGESPGNRGRSSFGVPCEPGRRRKSPWMAKGGAGRR